MADGMRGGRSSLLKKSTEVSSTMPMNHAAEVAPEPMIHTNRRVLGPVDVRMPAEKPSHYSVVEIVCRIV